MLRRGLNDKPSALCNSKLVAAVVVLALAVSAHQITRFMYLAIEVSGESGFHALSLSASSRCAWPPPIPLSGVRDGEICVQLDLGPRNFKRPYGGKSSILLLSCRLSLDSSFLCSPKSRTAAQPPGPGSPNRPVCIYLDDGTSPPYQLPCSSSLPWKPSV